jgi:hypothetical protein
MPRSKHSSWNTMLPLRTESSTSSQLLEKNFVGWSISRFRLNPWLINRPVKINAFTVCHWTGTGRSPFQLSTITDEAASNTHSRWFGARTRRGGRNCRMGTRIGRISCVHGAGRHGSTLARERCCLPVVLFVDVMGHGAKFRRRGSKE